METTIRRKILIAVDGSDQALEAVRYISAILPSGQTDIVLFNVGTGFPEVFWDMNRNPLYRTKKPEIMEWLADYQLGIGEFNEKAMMILSKAGFPVDAVKVKTQTKKTGILKDIIQESYQQYSAIVVGRTGMSRLKDLLLRSLAYKLAEKIRHIPTVIVGGKPEPRKILIALDESIESMRGVSCIGVLTGSSDSEITICHCLNPPAMSRISFRRTDSPQDEQEWREYNENRFRPYMDEAAQRLEEAGIHPARISRDILFARGNTIQKIIETAFSGNFGTIVVGRREAIGFVQKNLRGRFSEQLIKSLRNMAVWVVS